MLARRPHIFIMKNECNDCLHVGFSTLKPEEYIEWQQSDCNQPLGLKIGFTQQCDLAELVVLKIRTELKELINDSGFYWFANEGDLYEKLKVMIRQYR